MSTTENTRSSGKHTAEENEDNLFVLCMGVCAFTLLLLPMGIAVGWALAA